MTLINPFTQYRMTQGWTDGSHARNPAMDYATPLGFEFVAPASGVYRQLPSNLSRTDTSAAGHLGELLIQGGKWDEYRIRFAHNAHHVAEHGATVEGGRTILAATGNTGYVRPNPDKTGVPWHGSHMHTYGLTPDGKRWNWTLYADDHTATPGTPAATPITPEEETMTHIIDLNNKHIFAVGQEFISHQGNSAQAIITRNVTSIRDEEHALNTTEFLNLLDGLGIPRSVVDVNKGSVLNPQTGKREVNGVWSRRREAVAKLDQLLARTPAK